MKRPYSAPAIQQTILHTERHILLSSGILSWLGLGSSDDEDKVGQGRTAEDTPPAEPKPYLWD